MAGFTEVKHMLLELDLVPHKEDTAEEVVIVTDEDRGVVNLILDCEDPILILEQVVAPVGSKTDFRKLLQINRTLVHGAFVLDEKGERVIWKDTLRLANLDPNELEGSIEALELALAENRDQLIEMSC